DVFICTCNSVFTAVRVRITSRWNDAYLLRVPRTNIPLSESEIAQKKYLQKKVVKITRNRRHFYMPHLPPIPRDIFYYVPGTYFPLCLFPMKTSPLASTCY
ncbi:unnamed protein product, partial [Laminaria digitata]